MALVSAPYGRKLKSCRSDFFAWGERIEHEGRRKNASSTALGRFEDSRLSCGHLLN
jgi:hypothetical protein